MIHLLTNLPEAINLYISFFVVYQIQFIYIAGTTISIGIISGAFYFYKFKR